MSGPVAGPLFGFVQVEYPWVLGPADGRYVLRGHAGVPAHVLMLATLGAVERRTLLGRKPRKPREAELDAGPVPVATGRATLVSAEPFATHLAAERWRKEVDLDAEADQAIGELNRVLHAHRVAAVDPFVRELSREAALVVRVGVGEGEPLAHGHFTAAVELPPRPRSKADARSATTLRPQERLAAILGGRDVALACEALALRARLDADAGRTREAALQLRVALEAAIAELAPWGDREALARRIDELRDERGTVGAAANAAINGGLDEESAEDVRRVLGVLEDALRARTAIGLE
ncbi:MAG: hypothetical protein H0V81_15610 [Solirubrobacterales bacterium]|nr:hypothetical protein [Solirubrobacterales bacterium]